MQRYYFFNDNKNVIQSRSPQRFPFQRQEKSRPKKLRQEKAFPHKVYIFTRAHCLVFRILSKFFCHCKLEAATLERHLTGPGLGFTDDG